MNASFLKKIDQLADDSVNPLEVVVDLRMLWAEPLHIVIEVREVNQV